jgi:hypothetical protein
MKELVVPEKRRIPSKQLPRLYQPVPGSIVCQMFANQPVMARDSPDAADRRSLGKRWA